MNTETQDRLEKSRRQRKNIRRIESRKGLNTSDYPSLWKETDETFPQRKIDFGKFYSSSTMVNSLDKSAIQNKNMFGSFYNKEKTFGSAERGEVDLNPSWRNRLENPLRQRHEDENLQLRSKTLKTKNFSREVDYGHSNGSDDVLKSVDFRTSRGNFIKKYEIDKDGNKIDRHIKFSGFYEKMSKVNNDDKTIDLKSYLGGRILDSKETTNSSINPKTTVQKNRVGYSKTTKYNRLNTEFSKEKQVFGSAYTLDKNIKSDGIVKTKTFGKKYRSTREISSDKLKIQTDKSWIGLNKSVDIREDFNSFGKYAKVTSFSIGQKEVWRTTKWLTKEQVEKIADSKSLIGRIKNFSMKHKLKPNGSELQSEWSQQHPWLATIGRAAIRMQTFAKNTKSLNNIVELPRIALGIPTSDSTEENTRGSAEYSDIQTPMNGDHNESSKGFGKLASDLGEVTTNAAVYAGQKAIDIAASNNAAKVAQATGTIVSVAAAAPHVNAAINGLGLKSAATAAMSYAGKAAVGSAAALGIRTAAPVAPAASFAFAPALTRFGGYGLGLAVLASSYKLYQNWQNSRSSALDGSDDEFYDCNTENFYDCHSENKNAPDINTKTEAPKTSEKQDASNATKRNLDERPADRCEHGTVII